jgi:hypothetical protein
MKLQTTSVATWITVLTVCLRVGEVATREHATGRHWTPLDATGRHWTPLDATVRVGEVATREHACWCQYVTQRSPTENHMPCFTRTRYYSLAFVSVMKLRKILTHAWAATWIKLSGRVGDRSHACESLLNGSKVWRFLHAHAQTMSECFLFPQEIFEKF